MNNNYYGIEILTDSYAGNFERQLCAHLTGMIGECEVGEELVDENVKILFEGNIMNRSDDDNCYRPVAISEDNTNNLIIFFEKEPTELQIETIKSRACSYNEEFLKKDGFYSKYPEDYNPITILGYRLLEFSHSSHTMRDL